MKDHLRHVPLVLTSQSLLTLPLDLVSLTTKNKQHKPVTGETIHPPKATTWPLENTREQQLLLLQCNPNFPSELHTLTDIQPKQMESGSKIDMWETYLKEKQSIMCIKQKIVMVMNNYLYSTFPSFIYSNALSRKLDLWVRSDISMYRHCWQLLSVHWQS